MASEKRKWKAGTVSSRDIGSTWALLEAELGPAAVPRPEGSITPSEFGARRGVSEARARHILQGLANAGKLRKIAFHTASGHLGMCYVPVGGEK